MDRTDTTHWYGHADNFGYTDEPPLAPAPVATPVTVPEPVTRTITISLSAEYDPDRHEEQLKAQLAKKPGGTVARIVAQPDKATAVVHLSA